MLSILENQKSNPCLYDQLMPKEVRIYNGGKDSFFSKWCWENWTGTRGEKNGIGTLYYTTYKNKLKMD